MLVSRVLVAWSMRLGIYSFAKARGSSFRFRSSDCRSFGCFGHVALQAEGLQRFATDYRALARLPEPILAPSSLDQFARDLAQLFAQRWPATTLTLDIGAVEQWRMDRDQLHQAVWALLNNATRGMYAHLVRDGLGAPRLPAELRRCS